ncbi:jg2308 [Pararge aegeria aegeria]|uniref:Jg2308 protein n=1 Tax=Pararge aegeria aegeria TaxID=348720 RepID=A0A8S4S4A3_9NEOP|nr:jg2308 [Pararge aegeria aegeria]
MYSTARLAEVIPRGATLAAIHTTDGPGTQGEEEECVFLKREDRPIDIVVCLNTIKINFSITFELFI